VNVHQTLDVADRIINRWKQNLAQLNRDDPQGPPLIEGVKVDAP
jgi:hypothetical protein